MIVGKCCKWFLQTQFRMKKRIVKQAHLKSLATFTLSQRPRQLSNVCRKIVPKNELSGLSVGGEQLSELWYLQSLRKFLHTSGQSHMHRPSALCSSKTSRKSASVTALGVEPSDIERTLLWQRYIYVQTSIDRWEDIPGGVYLDAAYLDSAPGEQYNPAIPLVVGLHSTPGNFYDLQPVLEAFVKSGCRVVAPAFPGHGYTEGMQKQYNDVFTHTTDEKAEFVRDFLLNLGIPKVDLLIAHGAACYPAMRLTGGTDTVSMFKSTALISPWPLQSFRALRRQNLLKLLYDIWDIPFYRPFARPLSRFVPVCTKAGPLERIATVYTLQNIDFSEVGGLAFTLSTTDFPRAVFFAEDDDYVPSELSYHLADMLGIQNGNITKFTGQLEKDQLNKFPSCMVFDKGGHYLMQTQAGIITPVLFNLLKNVRPTFAV